MALTPYAVILCRFYDVDPPNLPMSLFTDYISSGKGGLYDYWYQVSYGQKDLAGSKVFGWWTMNYSYINDGADPLKNHSQARGAWIAEARRLAAANVVDLSPFYGVIAIINANADDSDYGKDMACGIGGTWGQQGWKWCSKCQVLAYANNGPAPCAAQGNHDHGGSYAYSLALEQPAFPGQRNWRWCKKCQALNFGGNPPGPCPAKGIHDYSASGNYSLGLGTVGYPGQNGWMWCRKCQGLVFAGPGAQPGACAGTGNHDTGASGNYTLVINANNLNNTFCGHESGHTLGLGHSWYSPPENMLASAETEYGNQWDIMSAMDVLTFSDSPYPPAGPGVNAPNLDFLQSLPDFSIWTNGTSQTDSATIRLLPLNNPTLGFLTARVTKAESVYYVEYRQPTAWDRAFPSSAVFINEVRSWQWCNKCQQLTNVTGLFLGPCAAGGLHDHQNSGYYSPLHKAQLDGSGNPLPGQPFWKWCNKCQSMTYAGGSSMGVCSGGGAHDHTGSADYTLIHDTANYGQNNWKWCSRCQSLVFAGISNGVCAAGGPHNLSSSSDYDILAGTRHSFLMSDTAGNKDWHPGQVFVDKNRGLAIVVHSFDTNPDTATVSLANLQNNWKWCDKCQGLAFAQNPLQGRCPAGGNHTFNFSVDLSLLHDLPGSAGQNNWRWCSKCQGLAFNGTPSVCPAGGGHELGHSYDYMLLHDAKMRDAQSNWRWCGKCQGLAFNGISSGVCPAKGAHDLTHSFDYALINV